EDGLCGQRRVAVDERQGRRTAQMLPQAVGPGGVRGAQREAGLDDSEARVRLAQPGTELGCLRHADPAIVHREDRARALELLRELLDDGCLLLSIHLFFVPAALPANKKTRAQAGQSGRSWGPDDSRSPAPDFWTSVRRRSWAAMGASSVGDPAGW